MKRIGLVGEDPNDTASIKNLLAQKFGQQVFFKPLLKNIRGHQLDNNSTERSLKAELLNEDFDTIIFIRDIDGLQSENLKVNKVAKWFAKLNAASGSIGVLLKNIYELEALIFADIETFNNLYKTKIRDDRNIHFIKDPKEVLKEKTRKGKKQYKESDCPELFKKLRYDVVKANSTMFSDFENTFCMASRVRL